MSGNGHATEADSLSQLSPASGASVRRKGRLHAPGHARLLQADVLPLAPSPSLHDGRGRGLAAATDSTRPDTPMDTPQWKRLHAAANIGSAVEEHHCKRLAEQHVDLPADSRAQAGGRQEATAGPHSPQ